MRRLIALLLLTCLPVQVLAAEPPPCIVIESDTIDLEPKTDLEKIYFGAAVCFKRQRDDALAQVRSSSVSLAARTPEVINVLTSSAAASLEPEDSEEDTLLIVLLSGALGAILGGGAVLLLR